ncbi:MAG: hypothetical protein ABSB78_11085 [Bacteroidota bacterium]
MVRPLDKLRAGKLTTSGMPGWYFVTICTKNRVELFGDIVDGEMIRNEIGEIAHQMFKEIPTHYKDVRLDDFIIMPNHVHGIIVLGNKYNHGLSNSRGESRDRLRDRWVDKCRERWGYKRGNEGENNLGGEWKDEWGDATSPHIIRIE